MQGAIRNPRGPDSAWITFRQEIEAAWKCWDSWHGGRGTEGSQRERMVLGL